MGGAGAAIAGALAAATAAGVEPSRYRRGAAVSAARRPAVAHAAAGRLIEGRPQCVQNIQLMVFGDPEILPSHIHQLFSNAQKSAPGGEDVGDVLLDGVQHDILNFAHFLVLRCTNLGTYNDIGAHQAGHPGHRLRSFEVRARPGDPQARVIRLRANQLLVSLVCLAHLAAAPNGLTPQMGHECRPTHWIDALDAFGTALSALACSSKGVV